MFYTYAYLREDKTPYYIGKGKGNRVKVNHKHIPIPKDKSKIIILKNNLTEEEAFKHEIYMIFIFGRKDKNNGILINLTDGGDGVSGYKHTKESREKMKTANRPPITEETKLKMSKIKKQQLKENPRPYSYYEKNLKKMAEVNSKNLEKRKKHSNFMKGTCFKGKQIEYNGIKYKSISEAARKNNTSEYFILKSLRPEKNIFKLKVGANSQKWKCTITGHITTPGPLTVYQRAKNIDTSNRIKIK